LVITFLKCIIDLERNVLIIKSSRIETKFLPEAELPHFARLNTHDSVEDSPTHTTNDHSKTTPSSIFGFPYSI